MSLGEGRSAPGGGLESAPDGRGPSGPLRTRTLTGTRKGNGRDRDWDRGES